MPKINTAIRRSIIVGRTGLRSDGLPRLVVDRQPYLVAQSHQESLLNKVQSKDRRLEYPTMAQMRYHEHQSYPNKDLREELQGSSNSPRTRYRYKILGTGNDARSVQKPFRVGAVSNAVSASQSSMLRKPSKLMSLRDSSDGVKLKDVFIHRAGGTKTSPTGLPMDFDNRYTMEIFKERSKPLPSSSSLALQHLQTKTTNATAKLNSNFDYKKYKSQQQ